MPTRLRLGERCKNRKRDGTECAALDKEGKHATTFARADMPSPPGVMRCETKSTTLRGVLALCADIEVSVDHPAIDPKNDASMDVRVSKPGVQNSDELIDVQVTSPFASKPLD